MSAPDPKAVAEQMDNLAIRFPGTPLFRQVADLLATLTRERDEAREAALEEAAKVCDAERAACERLSNLAKHPDSKGPVISAWSEAVALASAIRALKAKA